MNLKVLLVDDHAVMREGLAALLSRAGIDVIGTAGNGREAVRLARELVPDAVVMDISMPDLNGIEAARQIRVRAPSVRVVMLSMHANREHVHQALAAGAEGYVLKEAAATEVATAVRTVAAGRRYLSPSIEAAMLEAGGSAARGPLESLSTRERQVLQLVVEGESSAEIARTVHLSPKTVETYRSRLMKKLGVANVTALVKFAVQHGLTPPG
ncbi:MAG: response regulator transcription factor [Betaproteobacteria bacterium]|nr:response regulator transcription factor [Betaproteobacteria bacterium]